MSHGFIVSCVITCVFLATFIYFCPLNSSRCLSCYHILLMKYVYWREKRERYRGWWVCSDSWDVFHALPSACDKTWWHHHHHHQHHHQQQQQQQRQRHNCHYHNHYNHQKTDNNHRWNKYERYYWTRKAPACLLTVIYAYSKPRLPPVHKYSSLRSIAHRAAAAGSRPLGWTLGYTHCAGDNGSVLVKVQCQV